MSNPTFNELQQLVVRALKDNKSPLTDFTQGSFSYTFARAMAAVNLQHYNRMTDIANSSNLATATGQDLDNIGLTLNLPRFKGDRAVGYALISTIVSTSTTLAPNTILTDLQTGLQFATKNVSNITLNNLTDTVVPIEALFPGVSYNLPAGTELVLDTNTDIEAYVGSTRNLQNEICGSLVGGTESESDSAYRQRIVDRISEAGGSTKGFIKQKTLEFISNVSVYVSTNIGGFVEVWIDSPTVISETQLDSLRTYLDNYIPAGILLMLKQANGVYVDIDAFVRPFLPADYDLLTNEITNITTTYIDSLAPGQGFSRDSYAQLLRPLVEELEVTAPEFNLSPNPFEKVSLRLLDIKYSTR